MTLLAPSNRGGASPATVLAARTDASERPTSARHRSRMPAARARSFRPDIEGLRAIAVVAVVLYHAGLVFDGGYVGVDVFFVLSGFLITRQLAKNVGRDGARALPTFYAHRIRRLLPAAVVVVVVTILAVRVWAPALQVRSIVLDGIFTTFYGLNYRLAALGTDYQHLGVAASPLQHFWSLGVEEQFYLVWPVLIVAISVIGRRHLIALLTVVLVAIVVGSTYYSVTVTESNAPWAYFSLHTRAWELALGALVAVGADRLVRLPRKLAGLMAWAGIAAIVAAAVVYTDETPFPGSAAWLPVGGTALVVAAGCGTRVGAERVLAEPLMQCLGRVSYSLYLWHWPILVIAPMALGHQLTLLERLAAIWVALVAAILSYFAVESPARNLHMSTVRWLATGLATSGAVLAAAAIVFAFPPTTVGQGGKANLAALGTAGARAAGNAANRQVAASIGLAAVPSNLTPQPADAVNSIPVTSSNGCHAGYTQISQGPCVYGDSDAARTVVLFGDSHVEQWLPAFDTLGTKAHWKVVSWTKAACPAATLTVANPVLKRAYTECDTWRTSTIARIGALQPDVVVVGQSENVASSSVSPASFAAATLSTINKLHAATTAEVVYLQDIPTPRADIPGCIAAHLDDATRCSYPLGDAYSYPDRHATIIKAVAGTKLATIDPASWFCADGTCPAIVGNILVYRNASHMTVPYSRWLSPMLAGVLPKAG